MIRILALICLIVTFNVAHADSLSQLGLAPCFDMNKGKRIAKEVNVLLRHEFCDMSVDHKKFASMSRYILDRLVKQSFLGVAPPADWQQLKDELIEQCVANKNLCQEKAQEEFKLCVESRIPMMLLQFAPWISEHCPQLNKAIIQQWSIKKTMLQQAVSDSKR